VTVPTPIDSVNRPNLRPLEAASRTVGGVLKEGDIVIYESTVFPGATEEVCVPILENESGLRFNLDFACRYSPERINPGDKVNSLTKIMKITSGSKLETADEIDDLYRSIIDAGTWKASSLKVAEAAKVIENSQRDLNIAFVNELSVIFERLDIDTLEVLEAAGSKWNFLPFRPGMVGGHCIGVDPYYLTDLAHRKNCDVDLIRTARVINEAFPIKVAQRILSKLLDNEILPNRAKVLICGVTFKENVTDIRNSKVKELIDELEQWNIHVSVYDPNVPLSVIKENFSENGIKDLSENDFDAIIFAVGHKQFKSVSSLTIKSLSMGRQKPIVFDLKSILDKKSFINDQVEVMTL